MLGSFRLAVKGLRQVACAHYEQLCQYTETSVSNAKIPLGKQQETGDVIMGYSNEQVNSFFCNMDKDALVAFAQQGALYMVYGYRRRPRRSSTSRRGLSSPSA